MVNHLARGKTALRNRQGTGLGVWAAQQDLPVIAVGDYNFDYEIDTGEGNRGMRNMLSSGLWEWVRPAELCKTGASNRYYSVLDFVFVAHRPDHWRVDSRILVDGFPFIEPRKRSDHRPVRGRVLIHSQEE